MPADPAIRAALEAAGTELALRQTADMEYGAAASIAIAAFLRAIGGRYLETLDGPMMSMKHLAAAVEAAAHER